MIETKRDIESETLREKDSVRDINVSTTEDNHKISGLIHFFNHRFAN